ncbi:rhodanese family protein [Neisseria weixii]|uniref:rhodanese family protein n=1 Tax=Neisseria weixii TaxID=1853276 RepID=UPI00359F33DB
MALTKITPEQAVAKIQAGAKLVDIRSPNEFAFQHIPNAQSCPLDTLSSQAFANDGVVIFHCLSGMRTQQNADLLVRHTQNCAEVYYLDGGLNAWKQANLPINRRAGGLDIMRQVQLIAGSLVLFGVILGAWVSPYFYGVSAFVGAGLMFAGLTGFCGMAKLLAYMPWNKV